VADGSSIRAKPGISDGQFFCAEAAALLQIGQPVEVEPIGPAICGIDSHILLYESCCPTDSRHRE